MTREEAIKIINCYDIGFYDLSGEKIPADKLVEAFDMAIQALEQESTKHGEWVESEIPHELYNCSNCGGACWSYDYERTIVKSNFCPNCGADMRGE